MKIPDVEIARHWRTGSVDAIKLLYRHVAQARKDALLLWDDVYLAALGSTNRGTDYESNFRSGRIAARKAALLYLWLAKADPYRAKKFEEEARESLVEPVIDAMMRYKTSAARRFGHRSNEADHDSGVIED